MPALTNKFKNNRLKQEPDTKPRKKRSKTNFFKRVSNFFKNRQFQQVSGLFFLVFAIFLTLSFISYFFTWKPDDTVFNNSFLEILRNKDIQIENMMGKLGAALSNVFIKEWFGAASFFFSIFFFLSGIKLVWPKIRISIWKTFILSLLGLIWVSSAFAYLVPELMNGILPGSFGVFVNNWLCSVLGKIGAGLVLLFILLSFLILIGFFSFFKFKLPNRKKNKNSKEKGKRHIINKTAAFGNKEDLYNTVEYSVEDEAEPENNNEKNLSGEKTDTINLTVEPSKNKTQNKTSAGNNPDDIDFTIENPVDEKPDNKTTTEKTNVLPERMGIDTEYDPKLDLPHFKFPTLELLNDYGSDTISVRKEELELNKNRIVETLNNYQIQIQKIKATIGPTVTLYEIIPAPGIRISKIKNLEDDIALSLAALGIRIIAPIPGKGTIGIEVPNQKPDIVSMKSVLASEKFRNSNYELPFGMGKTISNEVYVADLTKLPHILMAGATGQGKSVGLNTIIASLLYKKHPAELKFVFVDPKKVELTLFSKIERHYLAKLPDSEEAIITDTRNVVRTLNSLGIEMDNRYELLKDAQVRNVKEYNTKFVARKLNPLQGHRYLPYIVLVIDEFADLILTAGKEIEIPLTRLAQLARATGIHLVIATQRPSVNIITGSIKANFPARIAFRVIAKVDSRTILDSSGADRLIGRGDMLLSTGSDLIRLQCAFIDTPEIERLTDYIGSQRAYPNAYLLPEYADEEREPITEFDPSERDSLFEDAALIIVQNQQGSTSLLQRKLKLGYNRAGRIIDQLEAAGIVGHFEGSKAREVLIYNEAELEQHLKNIKSNE